MIRKFALVVLCLTVSLGTAWGQGSVGTLNGTVLDASGAVVPGATVVATNKATGVETRTTSTSAGAYTLPYLPSGTYAIRVTSPGFRASTADNVILRVAQTMTVNITLELGQITEEVTVSATPPLLESGSAEIGRYISTEEYKSWPIFLDDGQRQIQSFIFTSLPGTTGGTFEGSINGGQNYSHEILIEGIPVGRADLSGGNNNEFSPSAEAISEFKLQVGAIGAQYNGGQTAVANFSIKSGTNELHGSAFYYGNNEWLDAYSLATKTTGGKKTRFRQHNYGYSVGGPVYIPKVYDGRNKTFFFTDFEKDTRDNLRFSGFETLPTPAFKTGDFSRLLDPNFTGRSQSGTTIGTDALGRPIVYGQIYDPLSTKTAPDGTVVRDPFEGNIIPKTRWNPVAQNILGVGIPDPQFDRMINNISRIGTSSPYFKLHIIGVKGDHNISEKHRLSGYYNHSYRKRNNTSGARVLPIPGSAASAWQDQITPGRMVRVALDSTLAPTILNRVAFGYSRFLNINGAPLDTQGVDWAGKLGIQNTSDAYFPRIDFGGNSWQGGNVKKFGVGFAGQGLNGSWALQDDLTWLKGKHSFRVGYQYLNYFYDDESPDGSGRFTFRSRQTDLPGYVNETGHAFASFLLGAVNNASRDLNPLDSKFRQPYHAFYVMDDYKVTPKLTVNLGLRWEIIPPFHETSDSISYIDLSLPNPDAGNLPGALAFGRSPSKTYWKEFGPRFGFAYRASDKVVVRGGYAMTNTPPIRNDWGYGGFTYGYNGGINVRQGTSPTGFIDDPAMYLNDRFPDFAGTLPDTSPSSGNYDAYQTTAPDANRPGYVQNYNLTLQYQLPHQTVVELAYIGNKGTRLWGGSNIFGEQNGLPASLLQFGDVLREPISDHPGLRPFANFPDDYTVSQALRRYPQYFSVQEAFPYNTNSNYNALQVTVTRHLTNGLGFLAAYTWSKTIGYVDGNGPGGYYATVQDYFNRGLERSIASFNYPHFFKLTWVYEVPFGKGRRWDLGWANSVIGGWQLAAIHNYRSGGPISIGQSGIESPDGFSGQIRPDVTGENSTLGGAASKVDFFNPTPYLNEGAFAESPRTGEGVPLRVGTAPRFLPTTRGPHSLDEQFKLSKKFPIYERLLFQIGAALTNPFNRTNRYIGTTTLGDSDFGMLYAGGGGRTLQLEGRIEW